MIELKQLTELVTIVENKTLSAAAKKLYLSQPALSRSMQRLESDIGVVLFTRSKNKLELNENGKLAYELSKQLLEGFDTFVERLRMFDRKNREISVGSCAPAPLWTLLPTLTNAFPDNSISSEIKGIDELKKGLQSDYFQIIITNEKIDGAVTFEYGKETLFLCIPNNHPLATQTQGVHLSELGQINMLLFEQIGIWHNIHKELMPQARFIIQSNFNDYLDLVNESNLPVFMTDLSIKQFGIPNGRVVVPILDKEATQYFYLSVLKKNLSELRVCLNQLNKV
ncbi:MAG: LysR family transcriptional regulator [Roseburia sp.]|nr:LysR family transcriptional regulator [Roseburia sp.]